ncbi:DUF2889 domain-containing protein [Cryptosporangium minutisporangium]|uniref:DUF2889 domain-containing protein n=1 Tax=Cryptosporangium minutisporangium TaxID=113569 RepID=A0ABP6T917_9ACTN
MTSGRALHPRHGTHDPTRGTPARRPGSVRRTSTVDMLRPDGLTGRVVVDARARDLRTATVGTVAEGSAAHTRIEAEVDYVGGWTLRAISADPPDERLAALAGASLAGGFRRRVQETLPEQYAEATRLHLLLDDFPVATLVSGVALSAGGFSASGEMLDRIAREDLCSGWRSDGTIMVGIRRDRLIPAVTGPDAPDVVVPDDPEAWHERPPLPPHAVRRARRLDVWPADGRWEIDSLYRDSHVDADGRETVIHEWTVRGQVDPDDHRIRTMTATPQVLPWVECPSAGASAARLVGQDVRELRPLVRREFTGISTCTHLNDQLRQLADVPALVS